MFHIIKLKKRGLSWQFLISIIIALMLAGFFFLIYTGMLDKLLSPE